MSDITWRLEAYAAHWLTDEELSAVIEWMAANGLDRATAQHPVVAANGEITYGQDRSDVTVRAADRDIVTVTVPLRTEAPVVRRPNLSEAALADLQAVFAEHEWSAGFGGVCVDCSDFWTGEDGRVWCRRDGAVPWPCPPVQNALGDAGLLWQPRILGDTLDPDDNATLFAGIPGNCKPDRPADAPAPRPARRRGKRVA